MPSSNDEPNLMLCACIAMEAIILFNTKVADCGALPLNCLHKTTQFHSFFSHTICNRTYVFLSQPPFVYFGFFDTSLRKSSCISIWCYIKTPSNVWLLWMLIVFKAILVLYFISCWRRLLFIYKFRLMWVRVWVDHNLWKRRRIRRGDLGHFRCLGPRIRSRKRGFSKKRVDVLPDNNNEISLSRVFVGD